MAIGPVEYIVVGFPGNNFSGECSVPVLPVGVSYVEVAVGAAHTLARRSNGSVVAFGYNL